MLSKKYKIYFAAGCIFTSVSAVGLLGFAYSGLYNIGADDAHTKLVYWLAKTTRDRSIAAHAKNIKQPLDLLTSKRILVGAGLYNGMCMQCHLGPGISATEISQGLYPAAPFLSRKTALTATQEFWAIKHGIKMSGMPAWGKTHNDELIWDMVAFLRKLPDLSAEDYKKLVASAPADHDEMMKDMENAPLQSSK